MVSNVTLAAEPGKVLQQMVTVTKTDTMFVPVHAANIMRKFIMIYMLKPAAASVFTPVACQCAHIMKYMVSC